MAVANKKREDNSAWDAFVSWCQERGVSPMPANPWTLAAYARWCEHQLSYSDLAKAFKTIARVHNSKSRKRPDRDPLLVNTLEQIENRAKEKKKPKDNRPPLFPDDDILDPKAAKRGKPSSKAKPAKGKGKGKGKEKGKKVRPGLSATPKLVSKRKLKK